MSTFLKNPALTPTESLNATEIDFKILLMVLKYLKGLAPSYLPDLVDTFLGGQSDQQVRDNCSVSAPGPARPQNAVPQMQENTHPTVYRTPT